MPPQAFIIIFLLFFAVLAFGWFYWQRAKTRDAAKDMGASSETTPPSSSDQA
jgi:predicted negative regulator of RcsB-dependent stress response